MTNAPNTALKKFLLSVAVITFHFQWAFAQASESKSELIPAQVFYVSATRDHKVRYGCAVCEVPKNQLGHAVEPKQLCLEQINELGNLQTHQREFSENEFFSMVDSFQKKNGGCMLFVHGFNTSLEKTLPAAARVQAAFGKPVIAFDWPSAKSFIKYRSDEKRIQGSFPDYYQFLTKLSKVVTPQRISLIAHSLGNRLLCWGLQKRFTDYHCSHQNGDPPHFASTIFTSADVNGAEFLSVAPALFHNCDQIAIVVCYSDVALKASSVKHAPFLDTVMGFATTRVGSGLIFRPTQVIEIDRDDVSKGIFLHSIDFNLVANALRFNRTFSETADCVLLDFNHYLLENPARKWRIGDGLVGLRPLPKQSISELALDLYPSLSSGGFPRDVDRSGLGLFDFTVQLNRCLRQTEEGVFEFILKDESNQPLTKLFIKPEFKNGLCTKLESEKTVHNWRDFGKVRDYSVSFKKIPLR